MTGQAAIEGQCLCGAVSIELQRPADRLEICQCAMCRRWGGAFYAAMTGDEATVSGEDMVTVFRSSEWAERAFCSRCGSTLWFRFLPTGNRSFSAGLFDAAKDVAVDREIFADHAANWARLEGPHQRLSEAEILAEARAAGFSIGWSEN
ncbi:MAG: GFA family protein [Pseudomonadota bacterium]|jgi:hypothetical protein|nr:GFA family protein [Pseudomonadota bacterium]